MPKKLDALDLSREYPRSPRELLGGYVVAGRMLDKCRAVIAGTNDGYLFDCPLDNFFLSFAEIKVEDFKAFVATGATDEEVADWIKKHAKERQQREIVQWNNTMRDKRLSEMPIELQEFLESYIPEFIPAGKVVRVWFDVYEIEEGRL